MTSMVRDWHENRADFMGIGAKLMKKQRANIGFYKNGGVNRLFLDCLFIEKCNRRFRAFMHGTGVFWCADYHQGLSLFIS